MSRILALDIGSHMGLAWRGYRSGLEDVLMWKHWHLAQDDGKLLDRPHRAALLLRHLTWFKEAEFVPDFVVYERPFARGQDATRSGWGLAGVIEAVFGEVAGIADVDPSTVKKFMTGSGKAEKAEMIEAARALGYDGDNEHCADAVSVLLYAEACNITKETQ